MHPNKLAFMCWLAIDFIFLATPQIVSIGGRRAFYFDGFLDAIYSVPFALAPLFFFLHGGIANFLLKTFTFYAAYLFCRSIIEGGSVLDFDDKDINILFIYIAYFIFCHVLVFCFRYFLFLVRKSKTPPSR